MATYHADVTIKANEVHSERVQLKAHERVVGITTVGDWDENDTLGMSIKIDNSDTWYPVVDGIKGERAHVAGMKANTFHIIPDYGHPLSDLGDDKVSFVALNATDFTEKAVPEDRVLKICIRMYE